MFHNFDNRDRYYDLQGKPLAGCVEFMLKDGNTVAPIFDMDQVPISNPQITDILGRTVHQVFIDTDVVAYMYKYVGTGTLAEEEALGIDTSDQSKWALQYTVESASIDTRSITGESAMDVSDMDALRGLDVQEVPEVYGHKIITLDGYYEAGDCEPMKYIWDSEATLNDDNGSVIASDGVLTGRWIMVQPTEHCDSRHFGIFPQDSADSNVDHSTRITQLLAYCNTKSIRPYFNGSVSYPYFIYTSVAYNSRNPIDVSNDTKFVDKGNNNKFYGQWNGNPYFVNAKTNVNSKVVRHSWHFRTYDEGTLTYIVDSDWSPVLLSNIQVELEIPPASGSQFDDCDIVSNEMFTENVVLENLEVHTDWFADDYNWAKLSLAGCTIRLQNCKDANTYILLKNKQLESDYGDLGEQTIDAVVLNGAIIENANGKITISVHGDFEFHNVSLEIDVLNGADSINAVDSWLTINTASTVKSIQLRRGSLNGFGSLRIVQDSLLDNVDIGIPLDSSGSLLTISDSKIRAYVTGHDIVLTNNQVYATVEQTDLLGVVTVQCTGNMFHAVNNVAARHYIHPATANSIVNGVWMGNGSSYNTVHWIRLDRTNIDPVDSNHAYTYAGNAEPYLARWSGRNRPFTLYCFGGHKTSSAQGELVFSTSAIPFLFYNNRTRELTVVPRQQYWKMFSVGTQQICRTGHVMCNNIEIGIAEGSYGDHDNGWVPPTFTWGTSSMSVGGQFVGYMECVSRDDPGEADYKVGFEQQFQDHSGMFSYGVSLGIYPSNDFDSGSDETLFPHYPVSEENLVKRTIYVYIDPDYTTGNNPQSV